ncbi:aminoglycoside phosphotransferase family protein [Deinococcus pimensis]|uniref:aminoglycoside phosphotransferase family protein n=1 Tax=Deinococcus pimensis TaxID=309888 RepID=UPI0004885AF4|nr:aminoglycoside phosphotransferase family protein [Deinococcus pimensis]
MTSTNLAAVQALDASVLTYVLGQGDHQHPLLITDFTVDILSRQGVTTTDGLFLLRGHALSDGTHQAWSVVLKIFDPPHLDQKADDLWAVDREYEAYRSGLLSHLSGPMRTPRTFAFTEHEGQRWLWMEHVEETAPRVWALEHYVRAARQLGEFNGTYLTGAALPEFPWLLRNMAEQWSTMFAPTGAWESPVVKRFYPPEVQADVMRLWAQREAFYAALRSLPQVFSHFDFHRRNLLVRGEDVVAVDWAWCGHGAVGGDLVNLIAGSCMLGEWDVAEVEVLEAAVFEAYVEGLRRAGWQGSSSLVRLGYTAWLALQYGLVGPTLTQVWTREERQARAAELFGGTSEELAVRWAALTTFSVGRSEEVSVLLRAVRGAGRHARQADPNPG